jgi:nitric oxide reductase subunit C
VAVPPICTSCHIIAGKGNQVCPSLNEIAAIAQQRIDDPSYSGSATTAEEYILESILEPSAFCVPNEAGKVYCTNGTSIMPVNLDKQVSDLDALVTYLATPPEGE